MLAEGLIHLHFMSPYILFRNNNQTQQGRTVPAKIYSHRFRCGEYNMLVLLGENKGNKRRCHFILRKHIQIHGLWAVSLPSCNRRQENGEKESHSVLKCFLHYPMVSPLQKAKAARSAKLLIPLCISELLVRLVAPPRNAWTPEGLYLLSSQSRCTPTEWLFWAKG